MKQPDFFLVGAPKCGTTALSAYLRAHPRIFMCVPKEPGYFALDFPAHRFVANRDDYAELFRDAGEEHLAVGEASVIYMYSDLAIAELHEALPAARLLVMLRNPMDMAVSMHAQALWSCDESIEDFGNAWALCADRRAGDKVPWHCRDSKVLLYDRMPLLGSQLRRLLEIFPRAQVGWWFFDDLMADPGRVYRDVLSFLDVPDDGRLDFPRVNVRKHARSRLLGLCTQKTPERLVSAAMKLKRGLGIPRWGVRDALRRANRKSQPQRSLLPAVRAAMHAHFAPDIRLLEDITGRELGHWLESDERRNTRGLPVARGRSRGLE
ncbi:MAG: sulfotransferase domain-containing protein [Xanthomonadales bacterium]|nr:sulfotransferase domain-containing protein [Xanthomonadales bacterium]ODU95053.1 MAG: hypothetical protein ABT18_01895 [Rhodanobacter sp. SCN 66-43]OJY82204.1 MAG: hypothetical protein BGP23_01400 [Xanthomonadales bacterium 66-474]